jgi:RND family efflux transporter MFP subunit
MQNDKKQGVDARLSSSIDSAVGLAPSVPALRNSAPPVSQPPGKSPSPWIWAGLTGIMILGVALWYFQPWATKGVSVVVETVMLSPMTRVLAVNGRIAPLHQIDVRPAVAGEVKEVLVDEGTAVRRGDLLVRLDPAKQQASVRQAVAGLDAGLVAQSQAEANLARATALGQNIARSALENAQTEWQRAVQEVARLTAIFDQAQIELQKFTISAPIAGTVLSRNVEPGQSVDQSTALFTLADLGALVVETDVDEVYAARIHPGLPAVMQLKGDTVRHDGLVSFVAATVDTATGGLQIKISFVRSIAAPVGLTVTANIIVETLDAAISVPRAAIVRDVAGTAVFVAADGTAVRRTVGVVDWPAERVQVTEGLVEGERVILDATGLADGQAILLAEP